MKQRRALIVGIVIAALSLLVNLSALVLRIVGSESDNRKCANEISAVEYSYTGILAEYSGDAVCEVIVDMGVVMRSSTTSHSIRIINNSDNPLLLLDYSTQCRCMWLDISREPIEVGQTRDILLTFDSRGEWGSVGNYMEITTSNEDKPIVLWIGAEIE
ncbi:MAG: DUF1573 domain-containing protein [Alistipes sp.]|nr:DUF1573 domain-containing protein [Alistipes sp.]